MKDYQAFINDMESNSELREKIDQAYKRIMESDPTKSENDALVESAQALGYAISLADLEKKAAGTQELDLDQLEAVSGGAKYGWCHFSYACNMAWKHPKDTEYGDACWKNYDCREIENHGWAGCNKNNN